MNESKTYSIRINKQDNMQSIKRKLANLESKILTEIEMKEEDYTIFQLGELAQQIAEKRAESVKIQRLREVLSEIPHDILKRGSMGKTVDILRVFINTPKGEKLELGGEDTFESNYHGEGNTYNTLGDEMFKQLSDQCVLTQLSYAHKKLGETFDVLVYRKFNEHWEGFDSYDPEEYYFVFKFPSLEVTYSSP